MLDLIFSQTKALSVAAVADRRETDALWSVRLVGWLKSGDLKRRT